MTTIDNEEETDRVDEEYEDPGLELYRGNWLRCICARRGHSMKMDRQHAVWQLWKCSRCGRTVRRDLVAYLEYLKGPNS